MRLRIGIAIAVALAAGGLGGIDAQAREPSFSCAGPLRADERAICRSPVLSAQDRELAGMFDAIKGCMGMGGRDAFIGEQARWLRLRRECGASTACLSRLYRQRLSLLRPTATKARRIAAREECPGL